MLFRSGARWKVQRKRTQRGRRVEEGICSEETRRQGLTETRHEGRPWRQCYLLAGFVAPIAPHGRTTPTRACLNGSRVSRAQNELAGEGASLLPDCMADFLRRQVWPPTGQSKHLLRCTYDCKVTPTTAVAAEWILASRAPAHARRANGRRHAHQGVLHFVDADQGLWR